MRYCLLKVKNRFKKIMNSNLKNIGGSEIKNNLSLFEINFVFLLVSTIGIFGLLSFRWAVCIWLFSIILFGRVWDITYKEDKVMSIFSIDGTRLIEKTWRFISYCVIIKQKE